jgi:hypothetical protein
MALMFMRNIGRELGIMLAFQICVYKNGKENARVYKPLNNNNLIKTVKDWKRDYSLERKDCLSYGV